MTMFACWKLRVRILSHKLGNKLLNFQMLFGIITIWLFYFSCTLHWILLLIFYWLIFLVIFLHHSNCIFVGKLIIIFVLITIPHLCIICDTVRLAVFVPKRLGYRFNCYYKQTYYDYSYTDDIVDISNSFSIIQYHTIPTIHSKYIFSASLYG
eukprot:279479_1